MRRSRGITLFSLLLTLSASSALLSVAVPSMSNYLAKSESRAAISLVRRNLGIARNLAIGSERDITVCGVDKNQRCSRDDLKTLIIFEDTNQNQTVDSDEEVFYTTQLQIKGRLNLRASLKRDYIRFTARGNSLQAGSFIYCDSRYQQFAGRVTVSMAGRSYIGRDIDGEGRVKLVNGKPIKC